MSATQETSLPTDPTPAPRGVLVVDLDGTLLRTDLLYETLWTALGERPYAALTALGALRDGVQVVKADLAAMTEVDVTTLPYDAEVIERITAWRAAGGKTALVTASDHALACRVAAHLDLFDHVQGSDRARNLKGATKAAWLEETFGAQGFTYIGDSAADLAVWEKAAQAVSVGASTKTRAALDALGTPAEHLDRPSPWSGLWRAMRPQQWTKNLLVCVPVVFTITLPPGFLFPLLLAFLALSLAASAGYLINDLLDLRDDRSHPRKRARPFASGELSAAFGTVAVPGLLAISALMALLVSPALLGAIALYFLATVTYSVRLKQHTLVDICVLAFLFTLRIIIGGIAIGAGVSVWLLAFSMFIFFALAAVKRLAELTDDEAGGRDTSRRGYRVIDRPVVTQMATASGYLAVLVLALYVDETTTQVKFSSPWLLWGVCPLLIYWISRMVLTANRGEMHDDPLVYALTDQTSRMVVMLCMLLVVGALLI